jgi:hypothetical protein
LGDDKRLLDNKTQVGLAFANDGRSDIVEANTILDDVTADDESVPDTLCAYSLSDCSTPPTKPTTGGGGTTPLTNNAPVATAQSITVDEGIANAITLAGRDADNNTLTYIV